MLCSFNLTFLQRGQREGNYLSRDKKKVTHPKVGKSHFVPPYKEPNEPPWCCCKHPVLAEAPPNSQIVVGGPRSTSYLTI